jgi:hypothetical protein
MWVEKNRWDPDKPNKSTPVCIYPTGHRSGDSGATEVCSMMNKCGNQAPSIADNGSITNPRIIPRQTYTYI